MHHIVFKINSIQTHVFFLKMSCMCDMQYFMVRTHLGCATGPTRIKDSTFAQGFNIFQPIGLNCFRILPMAEVCVSHGRNRDSATTANLHCIFSTLTCWFIFVISFQIWKEFPQSARWMHCYHLVCGLCEVICGGFKSNKKRCPCALSYCTVRNMWNIHNVSILLYISNIHPYPILSNDGYRCSYTSAIWYSLYFLYALFTIL